MRCESRVARSRRVTAERGEEASVPASCTAGRGGAALEFTAIPLRTCDARVRGGGPLCRYDGNIPCAVFHGDVRLDYGRTGLTVRLPDDVDVSVLEPQKGAPLPDPERGGGRRARGADRQPRRWPSWRAAGATRWWSSPTRRGRCPTASCCRRCCAALEAGGHRARAHRDPGRHRPASRQHAGRAGGDDQPRDRRALPHPQPRGARRRPARASRAHRRAAPRCGSTAATSTPTSRSSPASSSRT